MFLYLETIDSVEDELSQCESYDVIWKRLQNGFPMDIRTWSYLALNHPSRGQLAPSSTVYVYPPLLAGWWFGRRPAYGVNGGIDSLNNVGKTMS